MPSFFTCACGLVFLDSWPLLVGFPRLVYFACSALFDCIIPFVMICVVSVRG